MNFDKSIALFVKSFGRLKDRVKKGKSDHWLFRDFHLRANASEIQ